MKRTGLIALLLAAGLGIQGCAAATSAPAETAPATSAPTTTAPVDEVPVASPLTPIHEDADKSIFLADAAQISAISGVSVTPESVDDVIAALEKKSAWTAEAATTQYASLIADAVSRETHDATRAVSAVAHDENARVKIVVVHTDHKSIAHIERGHVGD